MKINQPIIKVMIDGNYNGKNKDGINQCEEVWLDSASQKYSLNVYDAVLPNKAKIVFLAGELSNGVYGFFVPDDE